MDSSSLQGSKSPLDSSYSDSVDYETWRTQLQLQWTLSTPEATRELSEITYPLEGLYTNVCSFILAISKGINLI